MSPLETAASGSGRRRGRLTGSLSRKIWRSVNSCACRRTLRSGLGSMATRCQIDVSRTASWTSSAPRSQAASPAMLAAGPQPAQSAGRVSSTAQVLWGGWVSQAFTNAVCDRRGGPQSKERTNEMLRHQLPLLGLCCTISGWWGKGARGTRERTKTFSTCIKFAGLLSGIAQGGSAILRARLFIYALSAVLQAWQPWGPGCCVPLLCFATS